MRSKTHFVFVAAFVVCLMNVSWAATTYANIYNFSGPDGRDPATSLIFDNAGNLYGVTAAGGDFDLGAVFKLSLVNGFWTETFIYSFSGPDGQDPHGGLVFDSAGNLYGTTVAGGTGGFCAGDGCGTVFKLTPTGDSWTESVIYNFTGGSDGFGPGSGLVFDSAGNLFGTTPDGGKFSEGTVFELQPTNGGWSEQVIHDFTGGSDGSIGSLGRLVFDAAGNVYGVAELGGDFGNGTVYEMSPTLQGWTFETLYAFKGMPDAASPYGGVIFDSKGNLYGTTYFGGTVGMGAAYELSPTRLGTWQESVIYSFQGGTDGSFPLSTLVFGAKGNVYGTTTTGGRTSCDCGTVFQLRRKGKKWKETVIHQFGANNDGQNPIYELTPDPAGNLYGTAPFGGFAGFGMALVITP
jgi:uncharacterized repeat protein (TIGR03803 family)